MTPTASGLDEARARLTLITGRMHGETAITMPLGLPPVIIGDLRLLLASEAALRERVDAMEAAMILIDDWANAYPTKFFAEPDVLRREGISMSAMHGTWGRHITEGVAKISAPFGRAARLSQDGGAESVARGEDG